MRLRRTVFAVLLPGLMAAAGCHSYHVETTVVNRTGQTIQLLEVEYPSATFGADRMAAGEILHYRIQLRDSGPLKVQYKAGNGQTTQTQGPVVAERQEGRLEIVLLPDGKAEFHAALTPQH